jgi:hypothetical protein
VLPQEQLISELKELNEYLEKRHRMEGTTEERRQRAKQKGVFADLSKLSAEEIASFFQGTPRWGSIPSPFLYKGARLFSSSGRVPCISSVPRVTPKTSPASTGQGSRRS